MNRDVSKPSPNHQISVQIFHGEHDIVELRVADDIEEFGPVGKRGNERIEVLGHVFEVLVNIVREKLAVSRDSPY